MKPSRSCTGSIRSTVTRREILRAAALGPLVLPFAVPAAAKPAGKPLPNGPKPLDPGAGAWRTWLVPSVGTLLPPRPAPNGSGATKAEIDELLRLQAQRTDAIRGIVAFWDGQGGLPNWSRILLNTIKETRTDPVRASRAIALFHTALADATVAAWYAKFQHHRQAPSRLNPRLQSISAVDEKLPTFVSEHAAIAAAAAAVLSHLFPGGTAVVRGQRLSFAAIAEEAALSRLWAGANFRSDVNAGLAMGQAVAAFAAQRANTDGSSAVWDVNTQPGRLFGPQHWVPTPPANAFPPLLPLAGTWKPWVLESASQFLPPSPPALQGPFPSAAFLAETNEVYQAVLNLTPEQRQIALFWADDPGATFTPPGHWVQIGIDEVEASGLSTPYAARAMAHVGAALADAAIACWDCKFHYWVLRPITAIRSLFQPDFLTPIGTPPFPAYTSGHSTFSGAAARVLNHLLPGGRVSDAFGHSVSYDEAADQAALSRLYGGIHYRSDNDEGLVCGRSIADLVIQRAQTDGAA